MLGREAMQLIKECPVAYLPIGCLELHGDHLPMGLDVIKAHKICCIAAQAIGGIVFPPHFYSGIHRLDDSVRRRLAMERGNLYTDGTAMENLIEIIDQIALMDIQVLVLYSGHYPTSQIDMIKDIADNDFDQLSFPDSGAIGSLSYNKYIIINGFYYPPPSDGGGGGGGGGGGKDGGEVSEIFLIGVISAISAVGVISVISAIFIRKRLRQ